MDVTKPVPRRTLLAGAAAAGAVVVADSLLPGSALANRQEADVVTLQFWTNHDATDVPLFQHVIRNFEATHPNIKIKMTNETGYGFIKGADGTDYFFHESEVASGAFHDLAKGDSVTFEAQDAPKGPRANNVQKV